MKLILEILSELSIGYQLNEYEAKTLLINMVSKEANPLRIAAILSAYMIRPANINELNGFKNAMLELAIPIDTKNIKTLDICGTGG